MSYCRWSSDNFACDLYCYADVYGGYTTHVAGFRHDPLPYDPTPFLNAAMRAHKLKDSDPLTALLENEAWARARKRQQEDLEKANLVSIDLPHDGETFNDPDLVSFLERVRYLKELGYKAPDYLEAAILEEMEEEGEVQP